MSRATGKVGIWGRSGRRGEKDWCGAKGGRESYGWGVRSMWPAEAVQVRATSGRALGTNDRFNTRDRYR